LAIHKINEEDVEEAEELYSPGKVSGKFLLEQNETSFDATEVKVEKTVQKA